jgi:sugar lactone lactonase YvrE
MVALTLLGPVAAYAVPDCSPLPKQRTLLEGQGRLESIIGDARGRLYYTDLADNRLLRLDGPGQKPRVLASDMHRPGGLVWEPGGNLIAGFSGGSTSGVPGSAGAGLFRVNPDTGAKRVFVSGIDQANGLARARDGSLYTSNDISNEIVRVRPNGTVQRHWVQVESANGLTIDASGRSLFVAQTFTPAKIARVPLANPAGAATFYSAPPENVSAGLDGLTRDGANRLYVAANGGGEVWRVGAGSACALARDLTLPSSVAFGGGGSFPRKNVYVVTFSGRVIELANATSRPPATPPGSPGGHPRRRPRLRLAVSPTATRVGRRTTFKFTVTSRGRGVAGATVHLAGKTAHTGRHGRARVTRAFRHAGTRHPRATRRGYRRGRATIRVRATR